MFSRNAPAFSQTSPPLKIFSFLVFVSTTNAPELGNNDVVDLGGAVFGEQGDVLYEVVMGFVESKSGGQVNHRFPGFTFEPGRFGDRHEDG